MTTKRKVDKKKTKQVRIDTGIHKQLKVEAAKSGRSIKSLLEGATVDIVGPINEQKSL